MFKFGKTSSVSSDAAIVAALNRSMAVIEFAPDGTILTANANFLNAVGYSLEEIVGRHHRMFVLPSDANSASYASFWDSLARGQFANSEFKRIAKGGREVWIQATYNPVLDAAGKTVKIVKFCSDVTQRKNLEVEMGGQLDAVSRSMAVISFTPDGTVLDANDNFLKTMGYRIEDIRGKHHSMFCEASFVNSHEYQSFWQGLRSGINPSSVYKRIGRGGKVVWIQASYSGITDTTGKVVRVVKFAMDVTEKRSFELAVDQKFGSVVTAISGVSQQTEAAASSVSQATGSMQSVAAGAEELSASIREISSSVVNTKSAVDAAVRDVALAASNTEKLTAGAAAMNSIIDFIQDVASNINLLALNATIESARAGAAGKGFAVVASEVKNLANQVAQATKKISSEIANIQSVSSNVVSALQAIEKGMHNVESSVTGVAGAIEEQTAVTSEISSNMQLTSTAVKDIEQSLQSIRDAATDINSQSQTLQSDFKRAMGT